MIDGEKEKLTEATTIGYKKIFDLRKVETDALDNHIEDWGCMEREGKYERLYEMAG